MIYNINIHSDVVNEKYLDFVFDEPKHNEIFIYGGAGSGKSYAVAQHLIIRCLTQDFFRCIYLRKVAKTIRNSQFQLFKDIINTYNLNDLFDVRETDMRITCKHNNNMLIAAGMDDAEKIKSIQDPTCVWLEEATDFSLQDYMQLRTRIRKEDTLCYSICTFNPVSKKSWLYSYLLRNSNNEDVLIIHSTADDNKYINDNYFKVLEKTKEYDEDYYNIYRLGVWGDLNTEKIFTNYEVKDLDFSFDCYGIDFGYTNPTAIVGVSIDNDKRIIYVKELLYQTHLTNEDLKTFIKENLQRDKIIYADSNDPEMIDTLYYDGINIKKAIKDVKFGLRLIQSYKLVIHPNSTGFLNEINEYCYQKDKFGNIIETPVKANDHLMDAFRYAVATYVSDNKQSNTYTIIQTIKKHTL